MLSNKTIAISPVPLPVGGPLRHDSKPQLIGMVHVAGNQLLTGQSQWSKMLGLPQLNQQDWELIATITMLCAEERAKERHPFFPDFPGQLLLSEAINTWTNSLKTLTVYPFLRDRALNDIQRYTENGINIVQFENVGAPYFIRNDVPVVDQLLMTGIVGDARAAFPTLPMGIQMLAFADPIALEIALKYQLFYVRTESFLFDGVRPEGRNPNSGNQAKAYFMRQYFSQRLGQPNNFPRFYADIQKKHTVFSAELQDIEHWLDCVEFEKLEGLIVTGKATGAPLAELDLRKVRLHVDALMSQIGKRGGYLDLPILAGSGVSPQNMKMYRDHVNAIIVGSFIKKHGNWEYDLNVGRLKRLVDAFNTDC